MIYISIHYYLKASQKGQSSPSFHAPLNVKVKYIHLLISLNVYFFIVLFCIVKSDLLRLALKKMVISFQMVD